MVDALGKLYEKLWRRVGGRPWTEIIRDEQSKSPLIFMLIFLAFGILLGKLAAKYRWQILLGFMLGVLCGHFWW